MQITIGNRYLVVIPITELVNGVRKPVLDDTGKPKAIPIPATAVKGYEHPVLGKAVEFQFSSGNKTTIFKNQASERLVEGQLKPIEDKVIEF